MAVYGYIKLIREHKVKSHIITIINFSQSSEIKRLWVIDMETTKVIQNTLVSHGRNGGNVFAKNFSNLEGSYKSSLGFYVMGKTYTVNMDLVNS
jgi:rRNA maturation protein Rpf1